MFIIFQTMMSGRAYQCLLPAVPLQENSKRLFIKERHIILFIHSQLGVCTPELLSVSLRPFHLPREFPQLYYDNSVYLPKGKRRLRLQSIFFT